MLRVTECIDQNQQQAAAAAAETAAPSRSIGQEDQRKKGRSGKKNGNRNAFTHSLSLSAWLCLTAASRHKISVVVYRYSPYILTCVCAVCCCVILDDPGRTLAGEKSHPETDEADFLVWDLQLCPIG